MGFFGYDVVLLTDFGPPLDIFVNLSMGKFCCKNVRVSAIYGLKPSYYNRILLLAEMEESEN